MRSMLLLLAILGGFVAWMVLVVEAADLFGRPHWLVEGVLFAIAGIAWAWPAAWLIRRVMAGRSGARSTDTEASSNRHPPDALQP